MNAMYRDIGLLLMRIGFGGLMFVFHGWPKLMNFSHMTQNFADPFGLGAPATAALAVFAEVFCVFAVIIGLFTRLAAIPPAVTMMTVVFIVSSGKPMSERELPMLFLVAFLSLILTGGGRFSADTILEKLQLKRRAS